MFVDSDFAGDHTTFFSHSGWVILLQGNVICVGSNKQTELTRSSTEAEVHAISEGTRDLLFIYQQLKEFLQIDTPMTIYADNKAANLISTQEINSRKAKYIEVERLWLRKFVNQGTFQLTHVPTSDNLADTLTKPLQGVKFNNFRDILLGNSPRHPPLDRATCDQ
mmetsp:Transcript_2483/g.3433  ORF Transcript_2483/g.3433 Transcript_2483/m.3433 type:complete len:165 (-) Transcript_2483:10-504(-)